MNKALAAVLCCSIVLTVGARPMPKKKHAGKRILPIAIVINGTRLAVNPPPRFYKNHLLVPVRRTLTALGLAFEKEGRIVSTSAGAKTITLTIGSTRAQVDGEPVRLDAAPTEIQNVLYAPLRFFTEALGAQAIFDRQTNSVEIISTLVGRSGNGIVALDGGVQELGTITAIDDTSDPATVTLTYNASVRTVPIAADAVFVVQDVNTGTSNTAGITRLHVGDYAHVYLNRNGLAKRVVDAYGSRAGRVAAAAPGEVVLSDGHVITADRTTTITLNAMPATLNDIHVGDSVMVRYNIDSSEPLQITATRTSAGTPQPASPVAISGIAVNPSQPLREGDTLSVTMHGTPHGTASFDIGPYVRDIAMQESSPGVYQAQYVVPRGVNFVDAPVFGHLNAQGLDAPVAESSTLVSVSTQAPGFSDFAPANGAVVNDRRPSIYATFVSGTVAVNPSSARIEVNGHDVTASAQRTDRFIDYTPGIDYPAGTVHVAVTVSDAAGNTATKRWTFFIQPN